MARSTFKVLFYLNRSKQKKDGRCPIMGRITIDKEQVQFSLGLQAFPDDWNPSKGRCKQKGEEYKHINKQIDMTEEKIAFYYKLVLQEDGYVTAERVKNAFIEKREQIPTVLKIGYEYLSSRKQLVGIQLASSTYNNYVQSYKALKEFLNEVKQVEDIPFKEIDYSFILDYDFFLKTTKRLSLSSAGMRMLLLRRIMDWARKKRLVIGDPFLNYRVGSEPKYRKFLTEEELYKVLQTPIKDRYINYIRHLFVFCCFTGIAITDLQELTPKHIHQNTDGSRELRLTRKKTGVEAIIPLLPMAEEIMAYYKVERRKDNEPLFERITRRRVSGAIKLAGEILQIKKGLTFHMARHTFATTICLSNGIPMETLSKILGHRSIATTQIYAKVVDKKISNDMQQLVNTQKEQLAQFTYSIKQNNLSNTQIL